MMSIFVILLILFAILSMGTTMMLPQSNIVEGLKTMQKSKQNILPGVPTPSPPPQPSSKQTILPGVPTPPPQPGAVCTAPDGLDGDCQTIVSNRISKNKDLIIKKCRGEPGPLMYETQCPYAFIVDNGSPANVCNMTPDNLEYVRKNRRMPNCGAAGDMLGPGGTEKPRPHEHHNKHGSGRRVPDNMEHSKYKKFLPSNLDELPISREMYEEIGKDFIKDEANTKGIKSPYIHDSEAEVLGRMVWRVYVAEMEQKRANSPKAEDDVMQREIKLLNKITTIMKNDTDGHRGKKCQPVASQASAVSSCNPHHSTHKRTTNQFGYRPNSNHNLQREPGHAFQGRPIHGSPRYHDISNATEHCFNDRACGGVNFDSTTGEYTLMPVHARLIKKPHYTALIKKKHERPKQPDTSKHGPGKHHHKHHNNHGPSTTEEPYRPITGIGTYPRDPNDMPRPYNSIMDLFG